MKPKMSRKKLAALIGGGVVALVVALTVLGAVFGTDEPAETATAPAVTVTAPAPTVLVTVTGTPAPAVTTAVPGPTVTAPAATVTLPAVTKTITAKRSTACVNALAMSEQTVRIQTRALGAAGDAFAQNSVRDYAAMAKSAAKVEKYLGQAVASKNRADAAAVECRAGK